MLLSFGGAPSRTRFLPPRILEAFCQKRFLNGQRVSLFSPSFTVSFCLADWMPRGIRRVFPLSHVPFPELVNFLCNISRRKRKRSTEVNAEAKQRCSGKERARFVLFFFPLSFFLIFTFYFIFAPSFKLFQIGWDLVFFFILAFGVVGFFFCCCCFYDDDDDDDFGLFKRQENKTNKTQQNKTKPRRWLWPKLGT